MFASEEEVDGCLAGAGQDTELPVISCRFLVLGPSRFVVSILLLECRVAQRKLREQRSLSHPDLGRSQLSEFAKAFGARIVDATVQLNFEKDKFRVPWSTEYSLKLIRSCS